MIRRTYLRKLAEFPFYPLLTGLSFPLAIQFENRYMFDFASTWRVLTIITAVWLLVHLAVYAACRRNLPLAGVVTLLVLIALLFPDDWMIAWLDPFHIGTYVPGAVAAAAFLTLLIYLRERMGANFTVIANVALAVSFAVPLWESLAPTNPALADTGVFTPSGRSPLIAKAAQTRPPNIHHIVLDGYASQDVMVELYGHDNGPFGAALRDLGFVIAKRSWAPYNQTYYSMGATFQGDYLDANAVSRKAPEPPSLRSALGRIVVDGPVHRALQPLGYRFVVGEPGMDKFFRFPASTRVLSPQPPYRQWIFEHFFFRDTRLFLLPPFQRWIEKANQHAMNRAVRNAFSSVETEGTPFHFYQHVLAPHPPFSMAPDGTDEFELHPHFPFMDNGTIEAHPERRPEYVRGYRAKTEYVERALPAQLARIVSETPDPKIIVVQSDHGSSLYYAHNAWQNSCLKERFSNFFAVYASDAAVRADFARRLVNDYNTVNIYRDIFRLYFGSGTAPLGNFSRYAKWISTEQTPLQRQHLEQPCAKGD